MSHFIIATHGELAEGFYKALKFFDNNLNNVTYINAYTDDMDFEEFFLNKLSEIDSESIIVFTDLPGGSVNQVVTKYIQQYNYKVITGINLSVALEIIFTDQTKTISDSQIKEIITSENNMPIFMNDLL